MPLRTRLRFEIYYSDLTSEAQESLLKLFNTAEKEENWETMPLAIIEREEGDLENE